MYIKIQFFEKKMNNSFNKPFFEQEIIGNHAVEIMLVSISEHFFGKEFSLKIKNILEERN